MHALRFEIRDGCLYAANTGRAFDRTAVVSICAQHLSSKGARAERIETPDCPIEELVATIRDLQIQLNRLNQLLADRNAEDELSFRSCHRLPQK